MAGQNEEALAPEMEQVPIDPWAMAFEALDQEEQKGTEADVESGHMEGDASDVSDSDGTDLGQGAIEDEARDSIDIDVSAGGPGDNRGEDDAEDGDLDWDGIDLSQEEIANYRKSVEEEVRNQAINDVAHAYIKQGARHTNGRLGATINDPDVCKRDSDGVPRFFNPETGREFTGDNPRRQAQEWADDYNRELAEAFNKTCQQYQAKLMEEKSRRIKVIEFAPKYKALDPMRRSMFDSIIEDYEVTDDDGAVIGYTIDLDKALNAVNRQVRAIQQRYSKMTPPKPASGPALDTPSTSSTTAKGNKPQFKSIEEAMEWEQDRLLEQMRNKKGSR